MNWRLKLMQEIDRAAMEAKRIIVEKKKPPTSISGEVWLDVHYQGKDGVWTEHYCPQIFKRSGT